MRPTTMAIVGGATALIVAASGCSSNSNPDAADGAAEMAPDAESDMSVEASGPAPCTVASVQVIHASNYDQSCSVNAECAAVGEGNVCDPCTANCYNAAINFRSVPRYLSDVARASGGPQSGVACDCPVEFFACCREGTCHADLECQNSLSSVDAGADTGVDGSTDGGVPQDAGPQDAGADGGADAGPADTGAE